MKTRNFLIALIAVLFVGCTTSSDFEKLVSGDAASEPAAVVAAEEPVVKEPLKIITLKFYPILEESYFGDGVMDEYRVFIYDENGEFLLKEEVYTADQNLQQSLVIEYVDSVTSLKRNFDADGGLLSYSHNIIDTDGNLLIKKNYNNQDVLQSSMEYEYLDSLKSKWMVYDDSGSIMNTTNYIYQNNQLIRIENLGPGGDVEEYFEIAYDDGGKMISETLYNNESKVESSRSFEYEDGFLIMVKYLRKNGSIQRKIMYKNDHFGNQIETVYMDAGDNVQERIIRKFNSREVISYEK